MAEDLGEKAYQEKAEAKLTPVERVMTTARYEIMSHEQAFLDNGFPSEKLEEVAVAEENRVKTEFEAKEKEDPIRRFVDVLHKSAITDDEKIYAEHMEKRMEKQRTELAKSVKTLKSKAEKASEEFNLEKAIKTLRGDDIPLEMGVKGVQFATILLNPYVDTSKADHRLELTTEYETRVLKEIGVLEPNETLEDIKLYPQSQEAYEKEEPYHFKTSDGGHTYNLQTNISGVKVGIDFGTYRYVKINTSDLPVIQKIVDFPTS